MFSQRSAQSTEKNALALALLRHPPAFDLCAANPTLAELTYPTDDILAALDNPAARSYLPDPRGLRTARDAISAHLDRRGLTVRPEHVFLTSGTSEAYAHLLTLLCDPGDEILVPQPSYPLLEHLARYASVHAVPYPLRYDGGWHIDLPVLRAAVTQKTRAVLVVSPNNPTGSYLKRDELAALEQLGLPIISDEVFAEYPLRDDPTRVSSALCSRSVLTCSLFGLSKQAALPQWKVAWTCLRGPSRLVEAAAERLDLLCDAYLSVATATQYALPRLLEVTQPVTDAIRARLRRNLAALRAQLAQSSPVSVLDVEGGFYATLRLPAVQSEERWVLDSLERDSVYVQPGYFFDFHEGAHVIVSLLTPQATFDEGLRRILARVSAAAG